MTPRRAHEYDDRQTEAAHRVLVDLGQILAAFRDSLVVVGGWVPELRIEGAEERHVGSIDVDLALDAGKLAKGKYADLLKTLLDTGRYRMGKQAFQLVTTVDLKDGGKPIEVEVDFLASKSVKLTRNKPKLLKGFRVLQADACDLAFDAPIQMKISGTTPGGARNTVTMSVASVPDFLVMKAHALAGRDKPKDAYDIVYCLANDPEGPQGIAAEWKRLGKNADVKKAIEILEEKFAELASFGPVQVVEFEDPADAGERARIQRRAFELVREFLVLVKK